MKGPITRMIRGITIIGLVTMGWRTRFNALSTVPTSNVSGVGLVRM